MIIDLPVVDPAGLPVVDWAPGDLVRAVDPGGRVDLVRLSCAPDDLAALTDALCVGGPRVRLEVRAGTWRHDVDVASLVARGVVECVVDTSGLDATSDWVRLVAFLVAAREHGLEPVWHRTPMTPSWMGAPLLAHLTPPAAPSTAGDSAWVTGYRFGTLYWRRGPGFASVVDARADDTARYVIDEPALLALFGALAHPVDVTLLGDAERDGLAELRDAELVVVDGGLAVRLPYRLRHRPMPGNQV